MSTILDAESTTSPSLVRRAGLFLVCLMISFAPGIVGSRFSPGPWYDRIEKSSLTPPGWVFPIAWSALYLLMGISLFLFVLGTTRRVRTVGLAWSGVQLMLNAAWSWIFFGLERPDLALLEIGVLWLAILGTLIVFWRQRPAAGALLVPYLAWVSFASYLNFEICRLN
ncbi:MAG: TspO/MBR family protein [Kofleriaceae bacterium]